ncbi:Predicted E3 ubiquitin ligase [Phaffia rhodozyma]|uniref:GID complex catalytic subunit 2 n=1 Tax=Phaffia rhodozyma TaxID=264483 RepID=A0A0F7SPU4_PHARH|nr:Predicted E3 ubiquitin ligase [Phaffia rhodozyma]
MDAVYKELSRLEALGATTPITHKRTKSRSSDVSISTPGSSATAASAGGSAINVSLDTLVDQLIAARREVLGSNTLEVVDEILNRMEVAIEGSKCKVDEALKSYHKAIGKVGTALTKAMPENQSFPDLGKFSETNSHRLLGQTVMNALTRRAEENTVLLMEEEHGFKSSSVELENAQQLHRTLSAISEGDLTLAIQWATNNAGFLSARSSPLLFYLHRSIYLRKLLPSLLSLPAPASPPGVLIDYARQYFTPLFSLYPTEIKRLLGALLFASNSVQIFRDSPYADLADPGLHAPLLVPLFEKEFCDRVGWPRKEVLGIVIGLGASSSVGRIEKARKMMKAKVGSDWEIEAELPIEIPLPPSLRFHSIFTCPVSREQATPTNPPMMLVCGHTIARESFAKLGKGTMQHLISRTAKCPYCPMETSVNSALELHF